MPKHEEWILLAIDDLKTALILRNAPEVILGPIYFHAQQCAEKALKAYLVFKNRALKRTHDLVLLLEECSEFDKQFEELLSDAASLNPYISRTRYPDTAFMALDTSTADMSIKQAKKILNFVEERV